MAPPKYASGLMRISSRIYEATASPASVVSHVERF